MVVDLATIRAKAASAAGYAMRDRIRMTAAVLLIATAWAGVVALVSAVGAGAPIVEFIGP